MTALGLRMRSGAAWVLLTLWLSSCAAGGTSSRGEAISVVTSAPEEFDPTTLEDDDFLLKPSALPAERSAVSPGTPTLPSSHKKEASYRVQIMAALDSETAEQVRKEVEQKFKSPVYTQYDEDTRLYKIHLGNCRTALEAKEMLDRAKSGGFPESFIVRANVDVARRPVVARRPETALGFRVQIFSASSQLAAEGAQAEARERLGRDDVYVELEHPYFKVRVGNFLQRKEADAFAKQIKAQGYDDAFPARTRILVSLE